MHITYLFGAGASYNAIPVVKDLVCSMKSEFDSINERLKRISEDDSLQSIRPLITPELIERFKADYNWLINESRKHQSIDTLAKKLYLQEKLNTDLKKLKIILTIYFHLIQNGKTADKRYDSFLASILEKNRFQFPQNLKILNWNYDYQFEKAYSKYIEDFSFEASNQYLNIISKNSESYQPINNGFTLVKLNGTASFMLNTKERRQHNYFKNTNTQLDDSILCSYMEDYENLIHNKECKDDFIPALSFAWEEDKANASIIERSKDIVNHTEVLVVIGYSFPIFNRKIDKEIIQSMKALSKVYFQAPDAENLKERFLAIRNDLKDKLIIKTDVEQFVFPNEFDL